MYGGLTFNSSENERDKLITVQVTIDNQTITWIYNNYKIRIWLLFKN